MAEELKSELMEEDTQKGKFMVFQTGREYYGISISYVNEIVGMQPITAIPEVEDYIKGLINLRGRIIPVIDVRIRFKMEPVEYTDRTCIMIINVKSTTIGLIIEKIAEVEAAIEEKKEELAKPEYASSYSKLSEISAEIEEKECELLELMEEWEELSTQLEELLAEENANK